MKFEANPRLLDLLVGSSLYPEPKVCVRELVQNAWDAIELRRKGGDSRGGRITITFSPSEGWFEVADDGIGMDTNDVERSFLSVGADKLAALEQTAAGEQAALFGIGVLSVFLVASRVEVQTMKLGSDEGIAFVIEGLHDEIATSPIARGETGTTIRVWVRADAQLDVSELPATVREFVRHVPGVILRNANTDEEERLQETWDTDQLVAVDASPQAPQVRDGRTGFAQGLTTEGPAIANEFTLCSVGFLVERATVDLLPAPATLGFGGELDLHPKSLSLVMARERYQRDDLWTDFGSEVLRWFEHKALIALDTGHLQSTSRVPDAPEVRRNILLWLWAMRETDQLPDLDATLRDRAFRTVPFAIADSSPTTLERLVRRLPAPRVYFRRLHEPTQRARSIDDEGLPIQLTEEIRSGVRVGALRARGFPVIETSRLNFVVRQPRGANSHHVDEADLISDALRDKDIQLLELSDALESDMDLESVERLPVLRHLLELPGGQLRFARVPDSQRRVIVDPSGVRYLNVNNPVIQRLVRVIPEAVSNPLKRTLLEIYLGVEEFSVADARDRLLDLLESADLEALASGEIAVLTSQAMTRAVELLLAELESSSA